MSEGKYLAEVYISYAGNDDADAFTNSRDEIVQKFCTELESKGMKGREYKRDIQYKESLEDFMNDIADADYIVLVISDKYLRSKYCMYEAVELVSRNKRDFRDKVFPIIMPDANIFDDDYDQYIDLWETKWNNWKEKIKDKDPLIRQSLNRNGILYREISENIDDFICRIADMRQVPGKLSADIQVRHIVDSILKEVKSKALQRQPGQVAVMKQQQNSNAAFLSGTVERDNITATTRRVNLALSAVISGIDSHVLDSEKARKEYVDVQFEEISGEEHISPLAQNFIFKIRTEKSAYEDYRRSLVISALSLGLIEKYDDHKTLLLLDFVNDGDPLLATRALTGLILGLLGKEDFLSEDIERKLAKLQHDEGLQKVLLIIFFNLANTTQLKQVNKQFELVEFENISFFDKTQHWFLPFFKDNPVMKDIPDRKYANGLFNSVVVGGIDAIKYALGLLYPTLNDEKKRNLKDIFEADQVLVQQLKQMDIYDKTMAELEVLKYLLEFYTYAIQNDKENLVKLIEDEQLPGKEVVRSIVMNNACSSLLQANQYFNKQAYAEAIASLQQVLDEYPKNKEAMHLMGYSYFLAGMYDDAIKTLEHAKAVGVNPKLLYAGLGDSYFYSGDYDKAIQSYEALLTTQSNIEAIINIGRSYQDKPNPDYNKSLENHLKAYKIDPLHFRNLLCLGDCYFKLEAFTDAYQYYYKAFEVNGDNITLVKVLSDLVANSINTDTDFEKRYRILRKYLELAPGEVYPHLMMAYTYEQKEPPGYDDALTWYLQALEIDPTDVITLTSTGRTYQQINVPDNKTALKYFEKALEIDPANAEIKLYAAWSYLVTGDYETAKKFYEANVDSAFANVVYQNLGHLALINQNEDEARLCYKKSLALFNDRDLFYDTSLSDYEHLQKAGVAKEKLVEILNEVTKN